MKQPRKEHAKEDLDRTLAGSLGDEAQGLEDIWNMTAQSTVDGFPDPDQVEEIWDNLSQHAQRKPARPRIFQMPSVRRLIPWGSALALGMAAAFAFLYLVPVTETAPIGQTRVATLTDGSIVHLNSGSSIRHTRLFWSDRTVQLTGEAFFDVAHNRHVFQVKTFSTQITVLGTRFNVRAWEESMASGTTIFLEEGRVALTPVGQTETVEMYPGEARTVTGDGEVAAPAANEAEASTAWLNGAFVFRNQQVGEILNDLSRRYGVVIQAPVQVRSLRLTISIREPAGAEAVLADVAGALGLTFRPIVQGFAIE